MNKYYIFTFWIYVISCRKLYKLAHLLAGDAYILYILHISDIYFASSYTDKRFVISAKTYFTCIHLMLGECNRVSEKNSLHQRVGICWLFVYDMIQATKKVLIFKSIKWTLSGKCLYFISLYKSPCVHLAIWITNASKSNISITAFVVFKISLILNFFFAFLKISHY